MKTAFKRVALVAAAALAIGGISAVSAQAVTPAALSNTTTGAGTFTAGTPNTLTGQQIAGPANFVTFTAASTSSFYIVVSGGTIVGGATSTTVVASGPVNVATPTVGTITVNAYPITNGAAAVSASDTATITVIAALPGTVYSSSTVYAGPGSATHAVVGPPAVAAAPNATTDAAFSVSQASSNSSVAANFLVDQKDAAGVELTTGIKVVTASVTNGLLTSTTGTVTSGDYTAATAPTTASTYLSATPATGATDFELKPINGANGTSTVTISVNGVVVKTYSVTFTGVPAKIVLTAINPVIGVAGAAATVTANTNALKVQEFDANGNAIAVLPLSLTSGTTTTIASVVSPVSLTTNGTLFADGSATSTSAAGISLVGAAVGTTSLTVSDGTLTSNAVSVRVSSAAPTSVVFTTDAASYTAGGAGSLVTTISDAAGTVPAGTYAVLTTAGASSSLALTVGSATLPGVPATAGSVTVKDDGTFTTSFNAPLSDGTATISATGVTGVTVTPVSFAVASGSTDAANAATDAANEATDAANAATDAANAAADSADAATQAAQDAGDKADAALAAVTALSQQVTTLLAKVAALASTLAKITKAIAALPKK